MSTGDCVEVRKVRVEGHFTGEKKIGRDSAPQGLLPILPTRLSPVTKLRKNDQ